MKELSSEAQLDHVIFCGSRTWTDKEGIRAVLRGGCPSGTVIVHGGARGADTLAGEVAREEGYGVKVFPAYWETYGKAAGPIRNQQMLDETKPLRVFAFTTNLSSSKGTKDMVNRAVRSGVLVTLIGTNAPGTP